MLNASTDGGKTTVKTALKIHALQAVVEHIFSTSSMEKKRIELKKIAHEYYSDFGA